MVHYSQGEKIGQLVAQGQRVIVYYSRRYVICGYGTSRVFWPYKPAWTGRVAAVRYRQKYVTTKYVTAGFYCTGLDDHIWVGKVS